MAQETNPNIDREEHRDIGNVPTKAVQLYGYIPGTNTPILLSAVDNLNGTYSLMTTGGGTSTVFQGGAPWAVNGTVTVTNPGSGGGVATVYQGGAPWLVTGSVQASQQGPWNVTATIGNLVSALASIQGKPPVIIGDPITTDQAKIFTTQHLTVQQDPTQLFYEDWSSGAVDTVYNWNSPTTSAGATSTPSAGQEALATGTTASSYVYLRSKPTFTPVSPGFIAHDFQMSVSSIPAHAYAFWGMGTPAATLTNSAYATDAVGFEITNAQVFNAVTWTSGTRHLIATLTNPPDTLVHRYQVYFRGDTFYWVVDNVTVASQSTGALGPNVNTLPMLMLTGNDSSGSTGLTITSAAAYVGDTAKAGTRIQDPTHPQNAAAVTSTPVGNESALIAMINPQSIKKQTFTVNTSGDNTVYTPASGKAVKLLWYNITSSAGNSTSTTVILKLGTTAIDTQSLSASQPFAHTVGGGRGFYDGGANNAIVVNSSNSNTLYVNLEWLEY